MSHRLALTIGLGLAALLGVAACGPSAPPARTPAPKPADATRPDDDRRFAEDAVFVDGRLWLRERSGALWSVDHAIHAAQRVEAPNDAPVLGICSQGGDLVALVGDHERPQTFSLLRKVAEGWTTIADVPSRGDAIIAMACAPAARYS
jgi:hypothetical protein